LLAAPAEAPEIVVSGTQATATTHDTALAMVKTLAPVGADDQLSRWRRAPCLKVLGVEPKIAAIVSAKVRAAAAEAGAPVAPEKCTPNVTVVFTGDAMALLTTLKGKSSKLLSEVPDEERTALGDPARPVRWWYVTEAEGPGGPPDSGSAAIGANAGSIAAFPTGGRAGYVSRYSSSLIDTGLTRNVAGATVIIDVERATGTPLGAVAAYVARVILGPTRMAAPPGQGILGLFTSAPPPADLGDWDRAYLKALYRIPANRRADVQRAMMANAMAAELNR
jgi:hypothetical protein